MSQQNFAKALISWQKKYGRHDLPWQQDATCYRVWISEIMLQQTQVTTVIPYFLRFIQRFENVASLATAALDEVLHYWSGLGFYARARNLHKAANIIHEHYHDVFPDKIEVLTQLPGIGRSTAGAILSLAMKQSQAILDGNVKRILCRTHLVEGWVGQATVIKQLWQLAEQYLPTKNAASYNQALMDLGARVCTSQQPKCFQCPLTQYCLAYQNQQQHHFPQAKVKKNIPLKSTLMLLLINNKGEILLEKRPLSGIWGGLWSLPQCDPDTDVELWVQRQFNFSVLKRSELPELIHKFSHFHLHIRPLLLTIKPCKTSKVQQTPATIWYNVKLKLGLAKPVQRLIKHSRLFLKDY